MSIIKNNIEIEGLVGNALEREDLYLVNYSENDYIFLPKSKDKIKYLTKVIIEIKDVEQKVIESPNGKILNIHGRKELKLIYSEKSHDRVQNIKLDFPISMYLNIPSGVEFDYGNIEVLDAFFEVIGSRKVYSSILYLITLKKSPLESTSFTVDINESKEDTEEDDNSELDDNINETFNEEVENGYELDKVDENKKLEDENEVLETNDNK